MSEEAKNNQGSNNPSHDNGKGKGSSGQNPHIGDNQKGTDQIRKGSEIPPRRPKPKGK